MDFRSGSSNHESAGNKTIDTINIPYPRDSLVNVMSDIINPRKDIRFKPVISFSQGIEEICSNMGNK